MGRGEKTRTLAFTILILITKSLKDKWLEQQISHRQLCMWGPAVATSLFPCLKLISIFYLREQKSITLKDFSPPAEFCPAEQL